MLRQKEKKRRAVLSSKPEEKEEACSFKFQDGGKKEEAYGSKTKNVGYESDIL